MMNSKIFLRLATVEERIYYEHKFDPCMIGDAKLSEDDTVVIAYRMNDLRYNTEDVALFLYEDLGGGVADSMSIVNLADNGTFAIACRAMFKFLRSNFKSVRIPVDKHSPIVGWCDKLYERVDEDEDSIIFDGCKLKRKRRS